MTTTTDDTRRQALCEWLFANGYDPHDVPIRADLTIVDTTEGRVIRCEAFARRADGSLQLDERGENVATEIREVPLKTEPPAWWRPYEKPTREQLLATLERVRLAVFIADDEDVTDWQRGFRACAGRVLFEIDGEEPTGA